MSELLLVEEPLVRALLEGQHELQRQVQCGPTGRCDIWDGTTSELIECKARGDVASIAAAVAQLQRYRPYFYDPQLAVAVPRVLPEAALLARAVEAAGIRIIEVEKGVCV